MSTRLGRMNQGFKDAPFGIGQITGIGFALHRKLSGWDWGLFIGRRGTWRRYDLCFYYTTLLTPSEIFAGLKRYKKGQERFSLRFFSTYHLESIPSSLSERTKVWGRVLIISPIWATKWGAGRLRMPTTRPRWEKKRRFAFSPTSC